MNKALKVFLIIIVVGIFVSIFLFLFPTKVSKSTMEKELIDNKVIDSVVDYISELPYETVIISNDKDTGLDLFVHNEDLKDAAHIRVDNTQIKNNIRYLFEKCNYTVINKEGNTISFQRWTQFRDVGTGIVYSIDGHTPNESNLQFLTKLEPLSVKNWYYYEEDYNEWKSRQAQ